MASDLLCSGENEVAWEWLTTFKEVISVIANLCHFTITSAMEVSENRVVY